MDNARAWIRNVLPCELNGDYIERNSLRMVQSVVPRGSWSVGEWRVVCRMIHTCGDPSLATAVMFCGGAVERGVEALRRGAPIYVDAQMQKYGISISRLKRVYPGYERENILCHVADREVEVQARNQGLARSLFALRRALPVLDGAIVSIGNAPVALLELNRLILEEGLRPALVIGVPVGFVHVEESKRELAQLNVPSIIVQGKRGGSPLAVAALHALAIQAVGGEDE